MLEASDCEQADKVSPIFGAISDHMYGPNKIASTTHLFTFYVVLANMIFKQWESPKQEENDLIRVQEQISNFMNMVVFSLGPCQTSSFRASKFYMPNYIIQDLRGM